MADDDWIEDDTPVSADTVMWTPDYQPEASRGGNKNGGKRPPKPRNPSDKRLVFQVNLF